VRERRATLDPRSGPPRKIYLRFECFGKSQPVPSPSGVVGASANLDLFGFRSFSYMGTGPYFKATPKLEWKNRIHQHKRGFGASTDASRLFPARQGQSGVLRACHKTHFHRRPRKLEPKLDRRILVVSRETCSAGDGPSLKG
jgi:hypothetical protein